MSKRRRKKHNNTNTNKQASDGKHSSNPHLIERVQALLDALKHVAEDGCVRQRHCRCVFGAQRVEEGEVRFHELGIGHDLAQRHTGKTSESRGSQLLTQSQTHGDINTFTERRAPEHQLEHHLQRIGQCRITVKLENAEIDIIALQSIAQDLQCTCIHSQHPHPHTRARTHTNTQILSISP